MLEKSPLPLNGGETPMRGTHAVMATVLVKKDGTNDDAEEGLKEAVESVKH
jgi:hypothetical protein